MNKTSNDNSVYDYIKMLKTGGSNTRLFLFQDRFKCQYKNQADILFQAKEK